MDLKYLVYINEARVAQLARVLDKLNKYNNVFDKKRVFTLLKFKDSNHVIPIIEGKEPPYRLLYNLLAREL